MAYSQPGDLVGWSGLVRRSPCEWLTAATPLKLIGFQPEDFYELERESEPYNRWLDANNSPSELMAVLAPALRARPVAEPPEREVLRRILPGLRLVPAHQIRELPDDDAVWLWNSQPISGEAVQIGEVVDPERLGTIPLGEPLRLVRIERDLWTQALEPDLQAPDEIQLPDAGVSPDDRYADLLPSPQGDLQVPAESTTLGRGLQRVVEVTGTGPLGQTMSCLEMLARYYNVPFRRDVIERAASENLRGRSHTSLELIGTSQPSWGLPAP